MTRHGARRLRHRAGLVAGWIALRVRLVLFAAVVSGCPGRHIEVGPGGVIAQSRATGWHRKEVITKQEPERLIAEDGTICRVSPERYKATKIGTVVYCNWQ